MTGTETTSTSEIAKEIRRVREAIRYHRGQLGDYRCWVDDIRVYQAAQLTEYRRPHVPLPEQFEAYCKAFWEQRQRVTERGQGDCSLNSEHGVLPIPTCSDADLDAMTAPQLREESQRLRDGVLRHESKGMLGRTVHDDEQLYALLPEQISWNSALPPREIFLPHCKEFCAHCQKHPEHLFEWSQGGGK